MHWTKRKPFTVLEHWLSAKLTWQQEIHLQIPFFCRGIGFVAWPCSLSSCFLWHQPELPYQSPTKRRRAFVCMLAFSRDDVKKTNMFSLKVFRQKKTQKKTLQKSFPPKSYFVWFLLNHHDSKTWQKINHPPHPVGWNPRVGSPSTLTSSSNSNA